MSLTKPTNTTLPPSPIIDENIGFLRRIWRGRIWYGAEWYITVFGALILTTMISMTIMAPIIAPHDPNNFIGAQFIPPGGGRQVLIAKKGSGVSSIDEVGEQMVGALRNRNGVNYAKSLDLNRKRYQTEEELAAGIINDEVQFILVNQEISSEFLQEYSGLEIIQTDLGLKFILGTDNLGRDILSRLIWGARTVLGVALSSALFSSIIGITLGLISGFVSGFLDRVLSLIMDSVYSFPGLLLAIAMVTMLGPGLINVAIAVSVIYIPTFFRVVRGQVLSIKEELYIEAAKSLGAKSYEILVRYIFPNVIPSVVVVFSLNVADAILTEAGLSFIGLGLPPDIPDWGYDLSKGQSFLVAGHWWMVTFPGVLISLVAMGFSLLGEGLSEMLNPRLVKN